MHIIGIDVGTTNTKVCLFQLPQLELVALERFPTPQSLNKEHVDVDAEAVWRGIQEALLKITYRLRGIETIVSISIASFAQTIVLQDEGGNVLKPTIAWFDGRGQVEKDEVNDVIGAEEIYNLTGINAHSNHSLSKLLWIKRHRLETYKKVKKWTCMSGFIASRLTGQYTTDFSLASRTMIFDIEKKCWSNRIVEQFQLNLEIFPKVVESGLPIGELLPSVADSLRLPKEITVTIGGHDHMAGSMCIDLKKGNDILNSTGTTEGLLLLSDKPNLTRNFQSKAISNGLYVNESLYTFYGSMPSAGQSFKWFADLFSMDLSDVAQQCTHLAEVYNSNFESMFSSLCVFIPHLRGSGPPLRKNESKVLVYGMDATTSKNDLLFSMVAGLCFELKQLKISYEESIGQSIETIKVIGPASQNPLWLQMKADILQAEVSAYHIDEAVAKGAAIIAALKQGLVKEIPEAPYQTYKPKSNHVELFNYFYNEEYLPLFNIKHKFE